MQDSDGTKLACAACIRGHRVANCTHKDRELRAVAKKGRPVTQCKHCRILRKTRAAHCKCDCGENAHAAGACPKIMDMESVAPELCCCGHGGPCMCSLKKEPQLDSVRESDLNISNSLDKGHCHGALLTRPKLNPSKSEGSNLTVFANGGQHKPAQKHNQMAHTSGSPYSVSRSHSARGESATAAKLRAAEALGVKILPKRTPDCLLTTSEPSQTAGSSCGESPSLVSEADFRRGAIQAQEKPRKARTSPSSELHRINSVTSGAEQVLPQMSSGVDTASDHMRTQSQQPMTTSSLSQLSQPQELLLDSVMSMPSHDGLLGSDFESPFFYDAVDIDWNLLPDLEYGNRAQFTTSEFSHAQSHNMYIPNLMGQAGLTTPSTSGEQSEVEDIGSSMQDTSLCSPGLQSQYDNVDFYGIGGYSATSSHDSLAQFSSTSNNTYNNLNTGTFMGLGLSQDDYVQPSGTVNSDFEATKYSNINPFVDMPTYTAEELCWNHVNEANNDISNNVNVNININSNSAPLPTIDPFTTYNHGIWEP